MPCTAAVAITLGSSTFHTSQIFPEHVGSQHVIAVGPLIMSRELVFGLLKRSEQAIMIAPFDLILMI